MGKLTGKKNNLFKHGGHSLIRKYQEGKLDRRTSMGKHIEAVKESIIEGIGELSAPQKILLELILQKIIIISAIAEYCNRQGTQIVNGSGDLLPCLSKSYLAFSNALVRDIKALYELQEIKKQAEREKSDEAYLRGITGK
jgi:hypothetical protein